jgi:hypothetical protein
MECGRCRVVICFTLGRVNANLVANDIGFLAPKARAERAQGEALGLDGKKYQALKGQPRANSVAFVISPLSGFSLRSEQGLFFDLATQGFALGSLSPRLWR